MTSMPISPPGAKLLRQLVESAIGKAGQRDIDQGFANGDSAQFEPNDPNDDMSPGDD
ncbi:hypothetical protein [Mycolicibacterium sp. S3B2]|uniref:hypothetical protein n=1 Tax=Mycolicibacterium sp. S3B2 TaxID=3415120 RepID=UPI003C7E1F8A